MIARLLLLTLLPVRLEAFPTAPSLNALASDAPADTCQLHKAESSCAASFGFSGGWWQAHDSEINNSMSSFGVK